MGDHRRNGSAKVVTLREVAERAGVDVSTASRALTGRRKVTPAIATRVHGAATALGYSPNAAARHLRMARTMTVGLTFPKLDSPTFFDFIEGLSSGIEEEDYSLMLATARGDAEHFRTLVRRMFERRVDALFLVAPPDLGDTLRPFESASVPVMALFSRGSGPESLSLFTATEDGALRRATERLADLGHRRILYFGVPESTDTRRTWLEEAAERVGIGLTTEMVPYEEPDGDVTARVRRHLADRGRATALFVELRTLPRLMRALNTLGVRIPADMSLVVFGESPWSLEFGVPMASISHDVFALGRLAAETMLEWLHGTRPPDVVSRGGGEWVERASVGPAPLAVPPAKGQARRSLPR